MPHISHSCAVYSSCYITCVFTKFQQKVLRFSSVFIQLKYVISAFVGTEYFELSVFNEGTKLRHLFFVLEILETGLF